jgi:hypothetical protein
VPLEYRRVKTKIHSLLLPRSKFVRNVKYVYFHKRTKVNVFIHNSYGQKSTFQSSLYGYHFDKLKFNVQNTLTREYEYLVCRISKRIINTQHTRVWNTMSRSIIQNAIHRYKAISIFQITKTENLASISLF